MLGMFKRWREKQAQQKEERRLAEVARAAYTQFLIRFFRTQDFCLMLVNESAHIRFKKEEEPVFCIPHVQLFEARVVSTRQSAGMSVRIVKGVYGRSGTSESVSRDELKYVDSGICTLTNQRIVFSGEKRTHSIVLRTVIYTTSTSAGGIAVNYEGRQKTLHFFFPQAVMPELRIHPERVDKNVTLTQEMIHACLEGALDRCK